MALKPKFNGEVKGGKLEIYGKDRFDIWLGSLEGKKVIITVEQVKSKRSTDQNSLYWKYLELISAEYGDDMDSLHEYFKRKFLPPVIKTILGKQVKLPSSTTELGKCEFGEYLDKICAETQMPIPSYDVGNLISSYFPLS